MEHAAPLPFLHEALLFLILAGILIPLLQRLNINQVLGFLVVGMVAGPNGLGLWTDVWPWLKLLTFSDSHAVHSLAELGVIFLMFVIGLEVSADRMWALRRWVFIGGSTQVLLSACVIGALAYAFGNALGVSAMLGLVLSLSSTAVVMQLLTERRALASPTGQASFSILMLQDFAVVPLLILVDLLTRPAQSGVTSMVTMTLFKSVAAVVIIYLLGKRVVGPLFRVFAQKRQPEVFMALTLLVALGIADLTSRLGLSMALGAFLAGLLLAETPYRHEVEVTVEPFKGLLMGVFFMSVGMGIDLREVARNHVWILLSVMGLMFIKATIVAAIFRVGGKTWGQSVEGGLLLAQGGEFAFIVVGYAATAGLLKSDIAQFMLLVVSLSLMVTPLVARLGHWLGERIDLRRQAGETQAPEDLIPDGLAGHIVIAGYGRVGRLLASVLEQQGVPYIAIEQDAKVAAHQRELGKPVYYGNAARRELLDKLHTGQAAALLVTMDQPAAAMHAVSMARQSYPHLHIYARSRDEQHAHELHEAGATSVVPETLEAGLQLTAYALQSLGVPELHITAALDSERDRRVNFLPSHQGIDKPA